MTAVENRVAALALQVGELRDQFRVFGDLARLLAAAEERVATAEASARAAERELREAQRREAAALAEMNAKDDAAVIRAAYRRGYHSGRSAARRGASEVEDPQPRPSTVAKLRATAVEPFAAFNEAQR